MNKKATYLAVKKQHFYLLLNKKSTTFLNIPSYLTLRKRAYPLKTFTQDISKMLAGNRLLLDEIDFLLSFDNNERVVQLPTIT